MMPIHTHLFGPFLAFSSAPPAGLVARRPRRACLFNRVAAVAFVFALFLFPSATAAQPREAPAEGMTVTALAGDGTEAELPLVFERIDVDVDHQYASIALEQIRHNRSDRRLEAVAALRAGSGAEVTGFSYYNGEQRIVGEVFEKSLARNVYEDVTGMRRDPGLMEKVGEGSFTFRVFPIEPGERKRIAIDVEQYLERRGRFVELRFPTGLGSSKIRVSLRDSRRIAKVTSPTHALKLERRGPGFVVVAPKPARQGGELCLRYELETPPGRLLALTHTLPAPRIDNAAGFLAPKAGERTAFVAMSFTPPLLPDRKAASKDVTLVLDRSGSMAGEPLEQARDAAAAIVRKLDDGDRVNVVVFDDRVDRLYEKPRRADRRTRDEALAYLAGVREGGGTDIAAALRASFEAQHATRGHTPVVLFMTDGESDSQAALGAANDDRAGTRLFTVGIGPGVQKPLLARLAAQKRGRFVFIERASAITSEMATLFRQIEAPVAVDLRLEAKGATLDRTYPAALRDVFRDDEFVIVAGVKGKGPAKLRLHATIDGKKRVFEQRIVLEPARARPWVGRLWGKARVENLLEEIALFGASDARVDETLELALSYDLVTPYTAFLAIPDSELTDDLRTQLTSARKAKQALLAAHPEAASVSRSFMPPGDPVLSVVAPRSSRQVTAYFPFGLEQDLGYDPDAEKWMTRFLVPNDVTDGTYRVPVVIVDAFGQATTTFAKYTIDSDAPGFEVMLRTAGDRVEVLVEEASEPLREVRLAVVGSDDEPIELGRAKGGAFSGELRLAPGRHRLRIVATDRARNESVREIDVEVSP